jgi:tRNA pseudouridine38-40 synthase
VAHLEIVTTLRPELLRQQINDELPSDINVLSVSNVPHRFHARHNAVARSYLYQIAKRRTAFAKAFVWWVREPLDISQMRRAATIFGGMQDFRAFTDDDPSQKSTTVLIEGIELAEAGDLLLIRVAGSHFLWKMVRRLVGVMVEAGRRGLTPEELQQFMTGPSEGPARLTAPASGLFLERVFYEGDSRRFPLRPAIPVGAGDS